jgi:uncharacterized protein with HEPN domain
MSPDGQRDWRMYADDILDACSKIRRFVDGMTYEAFVENDMARDAVMRNVEIIGEAAKHLPDDVLARAPGVEWRKVRGMRDILAHGYFGISLKVVWNTATTKIEPIEAAVRALME